MEPHNIYQAQEQTEVQVLQAFFDTSSNTVNSDMLHEDIKLPYIPIRNAERIRVNLDNLSFFVFEDSGKMELCNTYESGNRQTRIDFRWIVYKK